MLATGQLSDSLVGPSQGLGRKPRLRLGRCVKGFSTPDTDLSAPLRSIYLLSGELLPSSFSI